MSRFLAYYTKYVSQLTDAPESFGHAAGLCCLSTIALGRRWIDRGQGGIKPNLYVMLVAGSSSDRKSTTVETATQLLKDVEEDRVGPKDFTAEALLSFMARKVKNDAGEDKPQRSKLFVPMSEFGQYLSTVASYGATMATTLCALYDGEDYERIRATGAPIYISKPRVTILGAVAFGMLEKYADPKDWSTGFFNRFLFVQAGDKRPAYDIQPVYPTEAADWARSQLTDLARQLEATKKPMGISAEAEAIYRAHPLTTKASAAQYAEDPILSAQYERLRTSIWKLAMLYQIDLEPQGDIGPTAMISALNFAELCWGSFLHVFKKTNQDEFTKLAERVVAFVAEKGHAGTGRREVMRKFTMSLSKLVPIIETLVKLGALELRTVPIDGTGNRTKQVLVATSVLDEE